ncbi:hypothetical protein WSS15_01950 [Acetobacter pasteurianus]|uniref:Uncharacterized protein n=2 Tax=Acetobacter pasteurianus TaxID=438 RepID=C7JCV3_ACEP3|nr:hypothetical protein [Acetobacter pasteurianus]BAI04655.1 hypothetical protein APA07_04050 [Acetobacter pasteurianus IFO 3283-07]BAI07702.1 hypothetical protein APA22_04050 [Acetobacter pasteurianus IFO 3283-22]BAI10750.1 hypothetical protein APA26_04050 [Acetobacter pasteurianus IFO 3283-26]BAU37452.1 hypothetical protein APT_00370 [Acetobacter pasteurianus NBRC 101655]ASC05117.1 hypothetical protein S101468_00850 [Acetobacter pasteurianus subsp. pasteurianus]
MRGGLVAPCHVLGTFWPHAGRKDAWREATYGKAENATPFSRKNVLNRMARVSGFPAVADMRHQGG